MLRGKTIYHCHGKDKGKVLGIYETKAKALSVHRAIMASKARKKKSRAAAAYKAWRKKGS